MKKITFVSLLALLIGFTACSKNTSVSIDNPTAEAIKVAIDGQEAITVNANECKQLEASLAQGEHTMKVNDGEEIKFTLSTSSALLNPTKANYYIHKQVYGDKRVAETEIDKLMKDGTFIVSENNVVISLDKIDYGINEVLPETVEMLQTESKKIKTKIFNETQMEKYLKEIEYEDVTKILDVVKKGESLFDYLNGETKANN